MSIVTLTDLSLVEHRRTPRVERLRDAYFEAIPEVCVERARLITQYSAENGLFEKERLTSLDKARLYRHVLVHRAPIVWHTHAHAKGPAAFPFEDRSLFAGSTTSRFKGVPLYPEFFALTLWPELWSISTRASNPYFLSEEDAQELNLSIFPRWMEHNILELTRARCFRENRARTGEDKRAPEIDLLERLVFFITTKPNGLSHTIPQFTRAVSHGLRAMADEATALADAVTDPAKKDFYTAISVVLDGMITYAKNIASKAGAMAAVEADPARRRELLDIARIYAKVPERPAETFREGLTTLWICWVALHLESSNMALSIGRLDQILADLYRRDIDAGRLSVDEAIELLCCFWLKIGDHVPTIAQAGEQLFGGTGSNQAITIGGVDVEGSDAVNDLTYVILRATELMRLRDPNLNARYHAGVNPKEYLRRLCEVNVVTGATPAIHNDRAVIPALVSKGDDLADARDYAIVGCVEPTPAGKMYGHTGSILLNLTSALELTLWNGKHRHTGSLRISPESGDPTRFTSFADLRAAFEKQTRWLIQQATTLNNILGRVHQDFYPTPIMSALFEGPMEKGKDVIDGGALINSSGATIIGLADVADSLSAVQKVVFEERSVTFQHMLDAIRDDFASDAALQRRLMNPAKTPKYGNEDPMADENARWIVALLDDAFGRTENYRGGHYRVGYWTMTNHAGFGRLTQALPSGRRARESFTSGITPVSGVTPSLTATLGSAARLPARCMSSGVALNIKYTPEQADRARMLDNFVASVEGYFDDLGGKRDGGMEIQFNVTTHDTFVDAVKNPDKYPELLVRVSGYTAYFKDLNPQMQKEIIDRTEYLLSKGTAVSFDPFPLPSKTARELEEAQR